MSGDPKSCHEALTSADLAAIAAAKLLIRPAGDFTDLIAREECRQIAENIDTQLPKIYRGKVNTPRPNNHHGETYDQQFAHIEPAVLNAGGVDLLWALMHESLHLDQKSHPNETQEPYQADYFSRVRMDRGPNTCIK